VGVFKDVVFEIQPGLLIQLAVLRRAVGEVEGLLVRFLGAFSPDRVKPADEVAAVQFRVLVNLGVHLVLPLDARVEVPDVPISWQVLDVPAVYIDCGEEG
jgi:hypothetical protein